MPKKDELAEAEARVAKAQDDLVAAQQKAAEEGSTLAAVRMQNVPDMIVEVNPGNVVTHDEVEYQEGQEVHLPGPRAIAAMQMGHVTIKGAK